MARLVWNAIVRNEAAIIDRCVQSLIPHIDGAIIVDTGSTDGTWARIRYLFEEALLPVEIYQTSFENFSQARNVALQAARDSKLEWDYLLLADADMELKVHRPDWLNGAKGLSYDLKQTAGSVGYYNRRLVGRHATGQYVGVTHEYLDVATDGILDGAEFIDHADGANRPEKFSRDIALLEEALKTETCPGLVQRYQFYLAQSYFDSKNWAKAAEHYKIRTTLGGFDEEVWNAQLHYAHCLENLGDKAGFLWELLRAYELRPHRVESLYDLAKYFRERGDNKISLLFSESGLRVPYPKNDLLFVNNYVYYTGLREEFAICAYYDPARRERGAAICDQLALDRGGTPQSREQARSNQYWYLRPLQQWVPSFKPTKIQFYPLDDYAPTNPSVINKDGKPLVLVRSVNYTITPEGVYAIRGADGAYSRDNPISTRNYLVHLDHDLDFIGADELKLPPDWPYPKFDLVRGFEDSRLFEFEGRLWTSSTVRELTPQGWCDMVVAPVTTEGYGEWGVVMPNRPDRQHEKNWMPWIKDGELRFVYRLGHVVNYQGDTLYCNEPRLAADHISGGTQVVDVEGVHMAIVHEARSIPGRPHNRYYQHRFAVIGEKGELVRLSPPFMFHDRQVEFAAGLAYFPEKHQLMVSYGIRDCEAWLSTMDLDDVLAFIEEGQ